jgi:hypothetical protein
MEATGSAEAVADACGRASNEDLAAVVKGLSQGGGDAGEPAGLVHQLRQASVEELAAAAKELQEALQRVQKSEGLGTGDVQLEETDALDQQVEAFFARRDGKGFNKAFDKHAHADTKELPLDKVGEALRDLGIQRDREELQDILYILDADKSGGLQRHQFIDIARAPSALEQWATQLPFGELFAACVPHKEAAGEPLQLIGSLSPAEIAATTSAFQKGFSRIVETCTIHLREALEVTKRQTMENSSGDGKISKFSTFKMSCGSIDDFHEGLMGRVGAPSLEFEKAMKAEHCLKGGCDHEFTTGNYHVTTCAKKEWDITLGERPCPEEDRGHGRTIHSIEELEKQDLAKKAGLQRVEIIAVVLYTGPLFQVYNTVLRRFPRPMFEVFEQAGNLFSTTIHVLVSAIQKVARVLPPPEGLTLYCGLGGLMELPETFWKKDGIGVRGYMEWGFRSTTSNKAIAIQYSGAKEGRPLAMVMEIPVGSVDRGACIRDFSQYPAEVEYLWVPCSYIEPSGQVSIQVIAEGVVKFIPVRMNANLKALTIEALLGEKKQMHLGTFRLNLDEIRNELENVANENGLEERFQASDHTYLNGRMKSGKDVVKHIYNQCVEVYTFQEALPQEDFANDVKYRQLICSMLDTKKFAISKLLWWFEDPSMTFQIMGMCQCNYITDKARLLKEAHYGYLVFLDSKLKELQDGSEEQRTFAARVCRAHGWLAGSVTDTDDRGETPFLQATMSDDTSFDQLNFLKMAGSDINLVSDNKETALSRAVNRRDFDRIKMLHQLGADMNVPVNGIVTMVMLAVTMKDPVLVRLLVDLKSHPKEGKVYRQNPIEIAKRMDDGGKMLQVLEEAAEANGF